ncbi:MAG: DNA-binding response regulator [Gammaproteobacteria bacterium HGW-Gammaproteobacteria-13]|uniref:response regulator n=1 Tax=unclassified Pseudomonas TaxID=196821 RepID=UPI000CB3BB6D|nr:MULTISPECIES: response regulator transcription factor [unclassified Pseudomonas]MDF3195055.1 response regulator transcription factor [Pseudomonas sp. 1928-m]MDP2748972.1 response regulator transcription factor [Pseudomonas sp.]PKM23420.1 MAG: DNA-binding response regulator [Gammaproteobacteria bacterium HGW-Gammaproteobacteria-13]
MSARVVLVDDHELVRAGIRSLLIEAGYQVVAEGSDGDQVEALVESHQPDVLLLDLTMRRCSGLEALTMVRSRWPQLPVILLSMHDTRDYVLKAMQMGASGYLLKDAAVIELQLALQSVLGGHRYLSPRVAGQVIDAASGRGGEDPLELLTSRQQEVLYWLAKGKSNKEVAFILNLSVKTVDTHRAQIMERLAIRDLAGLVMYALRRGIIKLDD